MSTCLAVMLSCQLNKCQNKGFWKKNSNIVHPSAQISEEKVYFCFLSKQTSGGIMHSGLWEPCWLFVDGEYVSAKSVRRSLASEGDYWSGDFPSRSGATA